jgi:hypothetical protein
MQQYTDKEPDRKKHVWRRYKGGGWKCVLCGGFVEKDPTDDCLCTRYERLDETDHKLCPVPRG